MAAVEDILNWDEGPFVTDLGVTTFTVTYVVEGVWQKIEVEPMNVVLVNGEKRA